MKSKFLNFPSDLIEISIIEYSEKNNIFNANDARNEYYKMLFNIGITPVHYTIGRLHGTQISVDLLQKYDTNIQENYLYFYSMNIYKRDKNKNKKYEFILRRFPEKLINTITLLSEKTCQKYNIYQDNRNISITNKNN